ERTPRADPEMSEALESSLRRLGVKTLRGGAWTTDAPFRETVGKVRRYSSLGALAVEMECSALMAVAEFRGVRLAAGLAITDELFEGVWRPRFSAPEVDRARTALARAAVEVLVR
ncbi:MAG: phosphorylase, partial [Thermoproteota archaeon]